MMTVQVQDIVNNINFFKELAEKKLPARAAFMVARLLKNITNEYNLFQSTRENLIKKYGDKDENGELIITNGNVNLTPENIELFNKEIIELLESNIEIDGNKISLDMLEGLDFTPAQMSAAEAFIEG